jgi:hypothetical protein
LAGAGCVHGPSPSGDKVVTQRNVSRPNSCDTGHEECRHCPITDAKAERERSEREVVEVGGRGGYGRIGTCGPPDGGPANLRRGGGGAEAEAVPSAGWREVAYALDASRGAGHE